MQNLGEEEGNELNIALITYRHKEDKKRQLEGGAWQKLDEEGGTNDCGEILQSIPKP